MTPSPLHWSFYAFVPFTTLILFLDSAWLLDRGLDGQWLADLLVVLYFAAMMRTLDDAALRRMMWLAVAISAIGEVTCSMGLEIWVYKKGYVPIYVPFGHAIVIGSGFQVLRLAWPHRYRAGILAGGIATYFGLILLALVLWHDTLSLVLGLMFAAGLARTRNRLLYMFMPLPVLFIELAGTAFGCWYWPATPLGVFSTTNPPVGSIALYCALDMAVLLGSSLLLSRPRAALPTSSERE